MQEPCEIPQQPEPPAQPIDIRIAEQICERVKDKAYRQNCVDDVHVTGDNDFSKVYLQAELDEKRATRIEVHADKNISSMTGKRQFVAVVKNRFTGKALRSGKERDLGLVQFLMNGEKYSEPVRVDSFGRASLISSELAPGRYRVSAQYIPPRRGESYYASESFVLPHTVTREKTKEQD